MKYLTLCFFFLYLTQINVAYNILVVFTHAGQSHFRIFEGLFQELGERGHNLTIISYMKTASKIKNSEEVLLLDSGITEVIDLSKFTGARSEKYGSAHLLEFFANQYLEPAISGENFQNFLKENRTYDVIIAEFFNSNAYFGIFTKFKAPVIGISSSGVLPWQSQWMGSPDNPSYIPIVFMDYSPYMRFFERVENTIILLLNKWWYKSKMEWPGTKLSRKYIGQEPMDPYKTDLFFTNTHHTLHGARPFTPSVIEVGGISIGKAKDLPSVPLIVDVDAVMAWPMNIIKNPENGVVEKFIEHYLVGEINNWINEADHGTIYFNLGSMIKGITMSEAKRTAFVKAFAKLPQRVLWKWENETMTNKPDNVMIRKWMPQFDILSHPNVKAFITHGGLGGTTESVYCGVPMVVMPQFGDQHYNAKAVEASGAGIILQFNDATEQTIYESVKKVLTKKFQTQAKAVSSRFRDRPLPPLETAIYWIEHLARHKNGRHMRSAAVDMPFYQYFLLDVIGFFIFVISVLSYLLRMVIRFVVTLRKKPKQKTS